MNFQQALKTDQSYFLASSTLAGFKSFLDKAFDLTEAFINREAPKEAEGKSIFFGLSKNLQNAWPRYQSLGLTPYALADNDRLQSWQDDSDRKQGTTFMGLRVLSPAEVAAEKGAEVVICVSTKTSYQNIQTQLQSLGITISEAKNNFFQALVINWTTRFFLKHWAEIEIVYNQLDDNRSKDIYLTTLKARCQDRDMAALAYNSIMEGDQYWAISQFKELKDPVFVDCGAFTGDTVTSFLYHYLGKGFAKIYALEPNADLFRALKETVAGFSLPPEKIVCSPNGVGEALSGSFPTLPLEEIVKGPVNLIKADIEGAEGAMLNSAANIIKRDKPHLAICIYHRPEDLFELPLLIKSIEPNYKLAVRHHTSNSSETVLYAWIE